MAVCLPLGFKLSIKMSLMKEYLKLESYNEKLALEFWDPLYRDLANVAAGKFDGFWCKRLNLWDIAAGLILVREAEDLFKRKRK